MMESSNEYHLMQLRSGWLPQKRSVSGLEEK
jgi:hypothetical protein